MDPLERSFGGKEKMMTYPNSYALLSEEELEYTTGGALDAETVGNWISTAMNVTMGVLAIVNVVNAIKKGQISSVLASVLGTGAGLLAYVNMANIGAVAAQVQKQHPEQYPEEEGTINGNLIRCRKRPRRKKVVPVSLQRETKTKRQMQPQKHRHHRKMIRRQSFLQGIPDIRRQL